LWHRLALYLGGTVAELQARMSSAEFTRWVAYSNLEPFGYHMDNFRMGQIAATVFNVGRAKNVSPLAPSAFYPERKTVKPKRQLSKRQQEYVRKHHRESNARATPKRAQKNGKSK
jgi:hypothetical protein